MVENFLMNQIRMNDPSKDSIKLLGQKLMEKFQKDYARSFNTCLNSQSIKKLEVYYHDFGDKIRHLDSCFNQSLIRKTELQKKNIQIYITESVAKYSSTNYCQLIDSNSVLYSEEGIKNVTGSFLKNYIQSEYLDQWIHDQVYQEDFFASWYFEYHKIIHYFKNHKIPWIRELWKYY